MLAKFVPENVQSIMEGFRNALFEVAVFLVVCLLCYL